MTSIPIPPSSIERYRKAVMDLLFTPEGAPKPDYDAVIPPDMQEEWGLKHTNRLGPRDPNTIVHTIVQLSQDSPMLFEHFSQQMGERTRQTFMADFAAHLDTVEIDTNPYFPLHYRSTAHEGRH